MALANLDDVLGSALAGTKGGKRPGAGRKGKREAASARSDLRNVLGASGESPPVVTPQPVSDPNSIEDLFGGPPPTIDKPPVPPREEFKVDEATAARYADGRARKEIAQANMAELKYLIHLGDYVKREHVRVTSARAISAFVQQMRGVRDTLERKFSVPPAVAERVDECIDEALDQLAHAFQKIYEDADAEEAELIDEEKTRLRKEAEEDNQGQ